MTFDETNERFYSLFELFPKGLVAPPSALSDWQRCTQCLDFWFQHATELQRHSHLSHNSADIATLSVRPFTCSFRLKRAVDSQGIPCGPFKFCGVTFGSSAELKQHKDTLDHINHRAAVPGILFPFLFLYFLLFI